MNYYGAGADKNGLYPGSGYPGASYGMPQPVPHQTPAGLAPGQPQLGALTPGMPQQTTNPGFGAAVSTHSAYPGMVSGQPMYRTMPSAYTAGITGVTGMSGLPSSYYNSSYAVTTLPYSTLQPIPQATPSIPSIASLPSVPAGQSIPSIQPSQNGYPGSNRHYSLSQSYMAADPLAAKQPGYPVGGNPMMPGSVSSSALRGIPQGYPAGSSMQGLGYPSSAMTTNPYPGMPGVGVAPQSATRPYHHGF